MLEQQIQQCQYEIGVLTNREPTMSVKIFDLQNGKEEIVTWFDKSHVQFHGGHSCSRKDISRFYGETAEVMLQNVQAIVDNYVKDMKKFDYPGKPNEKSKKKGKREMISFEKREYKDLCEDKLFKLQPPESLSEELREYNAGLWYQKEASGKPVNKDTPWVWRWNEYVALQMVERKIPIDKIREWIATCQEHKNAKQAKT